MGFMMGINLTLQVAFGVPTELAAIATLFTFWDPNKNHAAAYIAGFLVLTVLVNIIGVRWYGEIEFFFGKCLCTRAGQGTAARCHGQSCHHALPTSAPSSPTLMSLPLTPQPASRLPRSLV